MPASTTGEPLNLLVLVDRTLCIIKIQRNTTMEKAIELVREKDSVARRYLENTGPRQTTFCRFEPPLAKSDLEVSHDGATVENLEDALRDRKKIRVPPLDKVSKALAGGETDIGFVALYIEKLAGPVVDIEGKETWSSEVSRLFECLLVKSSGEWSPVDIRKNGGKFVTEASIPDDVKKMRENLSLPRRYKDEQGQAKEDRELCEKILEAGFAKFFAPETPEHQKPTLVDGLEYQYFVNVHTLGRELVQSTVVFDRDELKMKSSIVDQVYINPTGFSHRAQNYTRYMVGEPWPLGIYVQSKDVTYKYQPKTNFAFTTVDDNKRIPLLVGEVISETDETDRWRMLCQALALARLGYILTSHSKTNFVVMAVYAGNHLRAYRYLLYVPKSTSTIDGPLSVHILQEHFDLANSDSGMTFLLGLYNFGEEMHRMAESLDAEGFDRLKTLAEKTKQLPAWSSRRTTETCRDTVDEEDGDIQDAVADSEEMQRAMEDFDLMEDLFVLLHNPFVAVVHKRGDTGGLHYFKLLLPDRRVETDFLSFLAGIESPDNNAIRPVAFCDFDVGTLLLLPDAGTPVNNYRDAHMRLVPIAGQFLRGVAFLHQHKVFHCDLNPYNVVVDRDTGRLPLTDFGLAVRGRGLVNGFRGTEGWTAPEVGVVAWYDPLWADVWAAGKVLRAICEDCPESEDRRFLLGLSKSMMAAAPHKRPTMKTVVEHLDEYVKGHPELNLPSAS